MAYSQNEWDIVKYLYESGLSLNQLIAHPDVKISDRSSISKKAHKDKWKKGSSQSLYLITAKEFDSIYKIGITNDLINRLGNMQVGCPYQLYAYKLYQVQNADYCESLLHAFFIKKKIRGEWFRLSELDLSYIDEAMNNIDEVMYGSKAIISEN